MPTDPTKRWNWDLKVSQILVTKWTQTTSFGCAINKENRQEYPQIDKSFIRKIKIYLNDAKRKILL